MPIYIYPDKYPSIFEAGFQHQENILMDNNEIIFNVHIPSTDKSMQVSIEITRGFSLLASEPEPIGCIKVLAIT